MDGTLKKKPRKQKPAKKPRRKYIAVMFDQCPDGWIINGLRPGFVKVPPCEKVAFDNMARLDGFWPWRAECAGFVKNFGWWAYEITDTGEGQKLMGETCDKTSNG